MLCFSYLTVVMDNNYESIPLFWETYPMFYNLLVLSVMVPVLTLTLAWFWSRDNWSHHPMVSRMRLYARDDNWRQVGADIETEFR